MNKAQILSWSDYYPFGLAKDSRSSQSSSYRFGFQGQERDDEVAGEGTMWNYKYRMHNAKYARFFSVDPLTKDYPWNSPYAFSENRVIDAYELEGLESRIMHMFQHSDGTYKKENIIIWTYKDNQQQIKDYWHHMSGNESVNWRRGEYNYKNYSDGSDTYNYYPNNLDNAGTLTVLHQIDGSTIMDYTGFGSKLQEKRDYWKAYQEKGMEGYIKATTGTIGALASAFGGKPTLFVAGMEEAVGGMKIMLDPDYYMQQDAKPAGPLKAAASKMYGKQGEMLIDLYMIGTGIEGMFYFQRRNPLDWFNIFSTKKNTEDFNSNYIENEN